MSTHQQIDRVRAMLTDAFKGVESELAKCQAGQPAVDTERTLHWIASSLEEMIVALDRPDRPAKPGFWRVVSDTWPFDDPLGRKLIDAEYHYEKLK